MRHTFERHTQLVGADADTVRALLIQINARGSIRTKSKRETWSLITRNPLPKTVDSKDDD